MNTFYWHDYETWGAAPSIDRPCQFAGVRTDENLNIISDPLVLYCQPPVDIWPMPEACLVTGITPQKAQQEGLAEPEFIRRIHKEFSKPKTCVVGYNSIRFDDEVTRYTLYRNFYDPYEREWRNGNSRWDIIDVMRMTYALRPDGIEWPVVDGKPSFRLENLTQANNVDHGAAHDAYSDVAATIGLAKLIKEKKPALFDYAFTHRTKKNAAAFIDVIKKKPLLHVSSRFLAEHGCTAIIAPLAVHPTNRNAIIVYDLSVDPEPLITLSAEEIRARLFVATTDLPEGVERIPLKLVHINKSPVLATTKLLDDKTAARLQINKELCEKHWQKLRVIDFTDKLHSLYSGDMFPPRTDPEQQLYQGFLNDADKALLSLVRKDKFNSAEQGGHYIFEDTRYRELLFRYKARNYFQHLSNSERLQWLEFVGQRLVNGVEPDRSFKKIQSTIKTLKQERQGCDRDIQILEACDTYMQHHMKTMQNYTQS